MARKALCNDPTHTVDSWGCKECRAAGLDPRVKSGRLPPHTDPRTNGEFRYDGYKRLDHCEICFATRETSGRPLNTDHDHETGWVRGTLCEQCNQMLARAEDNIVVLQNAITYLGNRKREHRIKPGPMRRPQQDRWS